MCLTVKASCWRPSGWSNAPSTTLRCWARWAIAMGWRTTPVIWPGARRLLPECLIDYFPDDWLLIVDESHVTCSQLQAMYNGDQARKKVLIEHGFRLPSAADNRPLKRDEFWEKARQTVFVSATPGQWEMEVSGGEVAEQVIRPTGVLDPVVEVRPTTGRWTICWGRSVIGRPRTSGCWSPPSPSEWRKTSPITWRRTMCGCAICTRRSTSIERIEIIQDLRLGEYDVLVGVNLLREGLDLPEVSLVAILDADKEGFPGPSAP